MRASVRIFLFRSLLAMLVAVLAAWLRWLCIPWLALEAPYLFVALPMAIMAVAWGVAPLVPGLAIAISGAEVWLIEPVGTFQVAAPMLVRAGVFLVAVAYLGRLGARLRQSAARSERQAELARDATVRLAAALRLKEDMERELGHTRTLKRAVVGLTPDHISVKDREGRYTYANAALLEFLQRSSEQVLGHTDVEILGLELGARVMNEDRLAYESGEVLTVEEEFVVRGERFCFLTTRQLLRRENGEILGLFGCSRNLTRGRQLEASLAFQQARFVALVESIPVGICMVEEAGGKVVLVNREAEVLLGEGILGEEIMCAHADGAHVLPGRRALAGESLHGIEAAFMRSDGKRVSVRYSTAPVRDEQGVVLGGVVALAGMDEEIRAKEELRRRAEELAALMEAVPVAICVSRDPGCHRIVGNYRANLLSEAEKGENVSAGPKPGMTRGPRRYFHKGRELRADELPMQVAAATNREVRNAEFDMQLPSGQWRSFLGAAAPLRDRHGNVRGAIAAFLDVTERMLAERELRRATEMARAAAESLRPLPHEVVTPPRPATADGEGRLAGVRVLVAEDAALNQVLIGRFLEIAGAEVVVAPGGNEAVRMAMAGSFDVILMSVELLRLQCTSWQAHGTAGTHQAGALVSSGTG